MKKSLFFGLLLLSSAASAAPSSSGSSGGSTRREPRHLGTRCRNTCAVTADPNQTICRTQRETGSMLNRTRVCKTRVEWEAQRRDVRQTVDRAQTNRVSRGE